MARQTMFRQHKTIQRIHKLAAAVDEGGKGKFHYLRAHRPYTGKPVRGFPPDRHAGMNMPADYPATRPAAKTATAISNRMAGGLKSPERG